MAYFDKVVMIREPTVEIEKPMMQLKDYLVEDQSSCSSNGFKSFPRKRQCCTTVRFLMEIDLNNNNSLNGNGVLERSRSKRSVSVVLQRASNAVINAVKYLPYRKLLVKKSRFWPGSKGRPRLTLGDEGCGPFDRGVENLVSFSSSGVQNDVSLREVDKINKIIVGEDSMSSEGESTIVKEWPNEEEKEQFSPVSILDCPFEDDDHSSPNFHTRLEGTKQQNILKKIRRFENLTHLEPVDLKKRIAKSELEDHNKNLSKVTTQKDEINKGEEKAKELVKLFRRKNSYLGSKADNKLIFDYFKEISTSEEICDGNKAINIENEALKVMEDWVKGKKREVFLGWEVKKGRYAYVKDMERGGKWKIFEDEKQEVGLGLEANIWDSLVHEVLLDIL